MGDGNYRMDNRENCWEIKKCGREPGGAKAAELGVCVAATDTASNGLNSGENGGRICWALAGTLCGGEVQGTFADKSRACSGCEVFVQIRLEEGRNFQMFKGTPVKV